MGLEADVVVRRDERSFSARLAIEPGRIVVVVGPSGEGKTSIVRALLGLDRPAEGTIRCAGRPWFDAAGRIDVRPRDRGVGALVQELALLPHLSAWRNVAFGLELGPDGERPADRRARRAAARAWLDRLGVADRADAGPAALSGGERQRVALARALARDASALLLDEPFSALDAAAHDRAAAVVREVVARRGVPALVVTHDPDDAARLGARPLAMVDGQLR